MERRALGKGISALIPEKEATEVSKKKPKYYLFRLKQ